MGEGREAMTVIFFRATAAAWLRPERRRKEEAWSDAGECPRDARRGRLGSGHKDDITLLNI